MKLTHAIEISDCLFNIVESLVSKRNLSGDFNAEYGKVFLMSRLRNEELITEYFSSVSDQRVVKDVS